MVSISSLPFNCSQLEHVAFWQGRAEVTHTYTHTHRGHSAGSVKVQQVCSWRFSPIHFRTVSHKDSVFPWGQLRLWTVLSPLWKSDVTHQTCFNVSVHVLYVRTWRWTQFKNQPPPSENAWLKQWLFAPRTPQWGIYYSNSQSNVLLISHICLFFLCFDRNAYINTHQQRETGQ